MSRGSALIDFHFNQAVASALAELERRARKELRSNPELDEFVMCMGSHFFTKEGTVFHDYEAPAVDSLIDEWDTYLRLTGVPMRFTADGPIRRDW